jgi:hypothetical protein
VSTGKYILTFRLNIASTSGLVASIPRKIRLFLIGMDDLGFLHYTSPLSSVAVLRRRLYSEGKTIKIQ